VTEWVGNSEEDNFGIGCFLRKCGNSQHQGNSNSQHQRPFLFAGATKSEIKFTKVITNKYVRIGGWHEESDYIRYYEHYLQHCARGVALVWNVAI
jgi:hypothetical protein